jgi:shikimate 5-dehydrogenase
MALSIVDRVEPLAQRIGAINTVIVAADGSSRTQHRCPGFAA